MTFLIAMFATLGLVLLLLAVISKRRAPKVSTVTTDRPQESPPRAASSSKKEGANAAWTAVTVIIIVLVVGAIYSDIRTTKNLVVERSEPRWGDIEVLYLTSTPKIITWPEGAVQFRACLSPVENKDRSMVLTQGDKKVTIGYNGCNFEVIKGKPFELTSSDSQELAITLQWRK
jgi:hypothetical protein